MLKKFFSKLKKTKKETGPVNRKVYRELKTKEDFEALLQESFKQPVGLIKHSIMCGVSSSAFFRVGEALRDKVLTLPVYKLIIQDSRSLSTYVVELTGIQHESPQFLLFKDGSVVYHASHNAILAEDINTKLN